MHAQIASSLVLHRQGESPLMVADSYLVDREAKAATPATISTFAIVYSTILVERSMVFYKRGNLGTARTCVCMYHTYAGLLGVKCEELVSSRYSVSFTLLACLKSAFAAVCLRYSLMHVLTRFYL